MSEFGLFTEFYRKPFRQWPSLFSKKGLKYLKTNIVEWFRDIWSLVMLKFKLSGWSKKKFSKDAELMYTVMNEAYAQGDLMTLEKMCKPMMYSKLKADVKRRRMAFDWEVVRTVVPTKVIKVRCGKVMPRLSLGQVTVRFDQIQRVRSVPGALVARQGAKSKHAVASSGIAAKEKRVVEYYVFQREMINDNSPWSIYRKIDVPEWDLPKQ
ncbi:hypothetical protein EV175_000259 [Coemansia sp. RSA 1933]|nr:hypothetical protein EV175_000259 [Coemansia sp. RSA 1933]